MGMDLEIRLATPNDGEAILELLRHTFKRTISEGWWKWFYHNCPYGPNRSYLAIESVNKKLVGSLSCLPFKIFYNNQIRSASLCNNVCTHEDYQRKGIFKTLDMFAMDQERNHGSQNILCVPNETSRHIYLKVDWREVATLSFFSKYKLKSGKHICREVGGFSNNYGAFLNRMAPQFHFMGYKEHAYMNWRFQKRPDTKYAIYTHEEGGELLGYVVLKYYEERGRGIQKAHILDLHALSEEIFADLIVAAESFATSCDELNLWNIGHSPYEPWLKGRGFSKTGDKRFLLTHSEDSLVKPKGEECWWFSLGDNDLY